MTEYLRLFRELSDATRERGFLAAFEDVGKSIDSLSETYGKAKGMSIGGVLGVCVVPFLIPDALKLILAEEISARVSRAVRLST